MAKIPIFFSDFTDRVAEGSALSSTGIFADRIDLGRYSQRQGQGTCADVSRAWGDLSADSDDHGGSPLQDRQADQETFQSAA